MEESVILEIWIFIDKNNKENLQFHDKIILWSFSPDISRTQLMWQIKPNLLQFSSIFWFN